MISKGLTDELDQKYKQEFSRIVPGLLIPSMGITRLRTALTRKRPSLVLLARVDTQPNCLLNMSRMEEVLNSCSSILCRRLVYCCVKRSAVARASSSSSFSGPSRGFFPSQSADRKSVGELPRFRTTAAAVWGRPSHPDAGSLCTSRTRCGIWCNRLSCGESLCRSSCRCQKVWWPPRPRSRRHLLSTGTHSLERNFSQGKYYMQTTHHPPSFGTGSLLMSIMESKKFLPIMGENRLWKLWKGSWNRERMLLARRAYGDRKWGKKKTGGFRWMWSATWRTNEEVQRLNKPTPEFPLVVLKAVD